MSELVELQKHCFLLSDLMAKLPQSHQPVANGDIGFSSWLDASDWLKIAAGVERVEINTSRFDESVTWCGVAWEYESKRSELLTQIGTRLTTFNFVWGAFETVIKIINLPQVPPSVKKRASAIDSAIFYLKNEYDPEPRVPLYDDTLAQLRLVMRLHPKYQGREGEFRIHPFTGLSGLGAHVVRIIRNDFAHGSAMLPEPDNWSSQDIQSSELRHLELIETSSRVILLTIQMLLLAYLKDKQFTVSCLKDEDGLDYDEDVHIVLRVLHLEDYYLNSSQLSLLK